MVKVACVLRSGGDFRPDHVHHLRDMVAEHLPGAPFVCLSDVEVECDRVPLRHDWPGWWAKLELFRLPGPVIFFDLDTIIIRPLAWLAAIAETHRFTMLRDVYRLGEARQSSVMTWSEDMSHVYERFAAGRARQPMRSGRGRSDQNYLEEVERAEALQDLAPGKLDSFKASKRFGRSLTDPDLSVVVFHGRPRPWDQAEIPYPSRSSRSRPSSYHPQTSTSQPASSTTGNH